MSLSNSFLQATISPLLHLGYVGDPLTGIGEIDAFESRYRVTGRGE